MKRLVLALLAAAVPAVGSAGFGDLVPIPFSNEVYVDGFLAREEDRVTSGDAETEWDDTFFRERLSAESHGFWYSPRFLLYDATVSLGLRQERFVGSGEGGTWRRGTSREYDLRLSLLPEHPYNLFVHSSRFEPLTREKSSRPYGSVETSRGIRFRYRDKPWFLHAGWIRDSIETDESRSTTSRADAGVEYFRRFLSGDEISLTGAGKRSTFETSGGFAGDSDELHSGSLLTFGRLRIGSDVSANRYRQGGASGATSRQYQWQEILTANLPARFRADLSYRWQRSESSFTGGGDRDFSDVSNEALVRLTHRLFESLDSTATLLRSGRRGKVGESTTAQVGIALNYSKRVPTGMLLAGFSRTRLRIDSGGRGTDVVDEAHSGIAVPGGSFLLLRHDVIEETIVVTVRSPEPPHELVRLDPGSHYLVRGDQTFGTTEIALLLLPVGFPVPESYDFHVSYGVAGGDYVLESDDTSANASLELWNGRVTPYAAYVEVASEVVSGSAPGAPLDGRTGTLGLRLHLGLLRLVGEAQKRESELSPFDQLRAEVLLSDTVGSSTSLFLSGNWQDRRRHARAADPLEVRERTESVTGTVQQRIERLRGFTASLGGSWSKSRGLVDAESWSANASIGWRIGKLDLSGGANLSFARTGGERRDETTREHAWYFLRIRRQID